MLEKLKIAATIDLSIIFALSIIILFNNSSSVYGLASLSATGMIFLCIFLRNIALIILIVILTIAAILISVKFKNAFNNKSINKILNVKVLQMFIYVALVVFIYIRFHCTLEFTSLNLDYFLRSFLLVYERLHFYVINIITSLLFIKTFIKSGINKHFAVILWLSTIFPILDIAILSVLKRN